MLKQSKNIYRPVALILLLILIITFRSFTIVQASPYQGGHPQVTPQQEADLASVQISLDDLPSSFGMMPESQMVSMRRMLEGILTGLEEASLINLTGYMVNAGGDVHMLVSGVISPLTDQEKVLVNAQLSDSAVMRSLAENIGGDTFNEIGKARTIGNVGFGFSTEVSLFQLDYVVARRNTVLIELAYLYREGSEPLVDALSLAQLLDARAVAVLGTGDSTAFRPASILVPEITTFIPTPLDLSTRPSVIGTNLFLAAVLMIPFSIGAEVLTRTLLRHEIGWTKKIYSLPFLKKRKALSEQEISGKTTLSRFFKLIKPIAVILFYGLVFSLLDRSWKPFTITGVVLFLNMTVAYGMVGILDDILQWIRLRKWNKPADLSVMPTNLLLSIASTLTSRLLVLIPGLMFGTPKALNADETDLDEDQRRKLLNLSTTTVVLLGFLLWLFTILTTGVQRLELPPATRNIVGGLEGFFLIVSAVSLENIFIQLLGFPGGFGEVLRKKNRAVWIASLVVVTFLFYHSLINPRGELVEAVQSSNVIIFFVVLALFLIIVFGIWLYYHQQDRKQAPVTNIPVIGTTPPAQAAINPMDNFLPPAFQEDQGLQKTIPTPNRRSNTLEMHTPGSEKICPACGQVIKAEARLCRYCRAQFEVHLRGYCIQDHEVVDVLEPNQCVKCGHVVEDVHVESKLIPRWTG